MRRHSHSRDTGIACVAKTTRLITISKANEQEKSKQRNHESEAWNLHFELFHFRRFLRSHSASVLSSLLINIFLLHFQQTPLTGFDFQPLWRRNFFTFSSSQTCMIFWQPKSDDEMGRNSCCNYLSIHSRWNFLHSVLCCYHLLHISQFYFHFTNSLLSRVSFHFFPGVFLVGCHLF